MTRAIIVGAGVNGLTAASYLVKGGLDVLVLEKQNRVGGLAATHEFAPGRRATVGPDNVGLLLPQVAKDLGIRVQLLDPVVANASGLVLFADPAKSAEQIQALSRKDAEAYPRFHALIDKLCDFLRPLLSKPAPEPRIESGSDLIELLKLGWGFRQLGTRAMHELLRIAPMSLADFLDEWFENDRLKATLGAAALEGVCLGPRSAGTAALFLYQRLGRPAVAADLSEQLLAACGAKVRTDAAVARILVDGGRARGVALESGEEIPADLVLSALAARTTFEKLVHPSELPASFVAEVGAIRYRGVTAKLNLALSEPVRFRCGDARLVVVGESLDEFERAYDASKYGQISKRPWLRCFASDQSLSVTAQYVPFASSDRGEVEARILESLEEAAPGLKTSIVAKGLWMPSDYEEKLGLPEGNWHQGEMALDQMFFMRPVPGWSRYESPIEGLYLCGAATHPGGGITGACGYNAAKRVLKR
ncbi:MAG TPA: NAD(P)/FAD-dependent oxidoreductase [Vicinamibacteria bacterium]|nr:NAD(P)/FAD-dependent oxidoreductase [Vicinamibacteria bacterium]